MLVVNASTKDKDLNWIKEKSKGLAVSILDKTDELAKLDLQGPKAEEILQKLTPANLKELKRFNFIESSISTQNQ